MNVYKLSKGQKITLEEKSFILITNGGWRPVFIDFLAYDLMGQPIRNNEIFPSCVVVTIKCDFKTVNISMDGKGEVRYNAN